MPFSCSSSRPNIEHWSRWKSIWKKSVDKKKQQNSFEHSVPLWSRGRNTVDSTTFLMSLAQRTNTRKMYEIVAFAFQTRESIKTDKESDTSIAKWPHRFICLQRFSVWQIATGMKENERQPFACEWKEWHTSHVRSVRHHKLISTFGVYTATRHA